MLSRLRRVFVDSVFLQSIARRFSLRFGLTRMTPSGAVISSFSEIFRGLIFASDLSGSVGFRITVRVG